MDSRKVTGNTLKDKPHHPSECAETRICGERAQGVGKERQTNLSRKGIKDAKKKRLALGRERCIGGQIIPKNENREG